MQSAEIELRFAKTSLGDAEVMVPVLALPATTRALLQRIDRTYSLAQCLANARESRLVDAVILLTHDLIYATPRQAARSAIDFSAQHLVEVMLSLPNDELYSVLTRQAKVQLGLIQGFRMILALEKCGTHRERQALAIGFVDAVWRRQREVDLVSLRDLIGLRARANLTGPH